MTTIGWGCGLVIGALVLVIGVAIMVGRSTPQRAAEKIQFVIGEQAYMAQLSLGCVSAEVYARYRDLQRYQGDAQAAYRFSVAGVSAGICTVFKRGDLVYVEDVKAFSAMVRVRPQGYPTGYWTQITAVQYEPPTKDAPAAKGKTGTIARKKRGFPSEDPSKPWACNTKTYDARLCAEAMAERK